MKDTREALAIKKPMTENNLVYIYRLLYQNFRVNANQKSTIDTHTKKEKAIQIKHYKDSHQTTWEENNGRREEKKTNKNKLKTVNKMEVRTYVSIITLNVNGLSAVTKRHRLAEWI